ncbi:GMC family oxidoreductase [Georgenia halophila]|uniref:GMC family oxidoreductase n=1 Tax=Georgenia halophila TaxID=620889 RepID=UPI0031F0FCC7
MNATPDRVDAIVVGSGFGGAVTAARLAQAGFSVTVLERGRRWRPGEFPRKPDLKTGWLWQVDGGLYDIRWLDRMGTVQGAGWGGGSLVYANVFARPAESSLAGRWPPELRRDELDPYYDLAAHMLDVRPVPEDPGTGRLPDRTRLWDSVVEQMEISPSTVRPNVAVRFGDPETWAPNRHGVQQRGCAFVGECVLGCNHGAKASLDLNYLAVAERAGTQAVTDAEVRRIESDGDGWAVLVGDPAEPGRPLVRHTARHLFLAAGAVATTELLLQARDTEGTMPLLSRRLGHGFSGNGDFLALSNIRGATGDLTTGPTITTTTVLDVFERSRPVWFQVQDGAVPPAVLGLLDVLLPFPRLRRWLRAVRRYDVRKNMALLSMGHDAGEGVLALDERNRVNLRWRNRRQARLYRAEERVGPAVARFFGSPVRSALTWSLLRRAVTVHPLGGVPSGPDAESAVVDGKRQVHGYPGLYVMDGSVIPASTGVNPSATILASAERSIERIVRDMTGDPDWRAPEWPDVRPRPVPEDAAFAWMAERRTATAGDGVRFAERMRPLDVGGPALRLDGHIRSLDRFRADPQHRIPVRGTLELDVLGGAHGVDGTLALFPHEDAVLMRYELALTDHDGRPWTVTGTKRQLRRGPTARLRALTRLHLQLSSPGRESRRAVLVLDAHDVRRLGLSLRGEGFTAGRRIAALGKFAGFFAVRAAAGAVRRERGPVRP